MKSNWFPVLLLSIVAIVTVRGSILGYEARKTSDLAFPPDTLWQGRGPYWITDSVVRYGYELVSHTAMYLGPDGSVAHVSNGMNCQNCHLAAGTLPYAINFGKVAATYPQFRARNNGMQTIYDRINDCLTRSLNGQHLDSSTREMKAMYAYIQWLDRDVPKGVVRGGTNIRTLPYLDRAADPLAGKQIYADQCARCHGADGAGEGGVGHFVYPPLWGAYSYNDGAGLYRVCNLAGFVKNNMPFGTDYHHPQLTDEEAWDVAAFINSQPRPHFDQSQDWQQTAKKPVDFPFGPYADQFSETQHKFGPFKPILAFKKQHA